MPLSADQLITQMILDDSRYVQGGRRVVATSHQMGIAQAQTSMVSRDFASSITGATTALGRFAPAIGIVTTALTAAVAIMGAFVKVAQETIPEHAALDSMQRALESVEGSAMAAKMQMQDLLALTEKPGVGKLKDALEGYLMLRNSGVSNDLADRMVETFGMANARGGGDSANLTRILLAVSQILNTPHLQGDELRQLQESRIPVMRIMMERFGTAKSDQLMEKGVTSAQVIQALVEELEKMPKVTAGVTQGLQMLENDLTLARAGLGSGIWGEIAGDADALHLALKDLNDAGVFKHLGSKIGEMFESFANLIDDPKEALLEFGGVVAGTAGVMKFFGEIVGGLVDKLKWFSPVGLAGEKFIEPGGIYKAAKDAFMNESRMLDDLNESKKPGLIEKWFGDMTKGSGEFTESPAQVKANTYRERTARAVERMAGYFDQHALGGGDVMSKGINMIEMTKGNGSFRGRSSDLRGEIYNLIDSMIEAKIARAMG